MATVETFRARTAASSSSTSSPTSDATRSIRGFVSNVVELTELHSQLLMADCRTAQRRAVPSVAVMIFAIVVGLSGIPILLTSIAIFLENFTQLSLAGALLIVGLVAFVVAASAGFYAIQRLRRALNSFERSQSELKLNLAWLKSLLK